MCLHAQNPLVSQSIDVYYLAEVVYTAGVTRFSELSVTPGASGVISIQ